MKRCLAPQALLAALMIAVGVPLASCGSTRPRAHLNYPAVAVTVAARPTGAALAPGFVGFSFEYWAVPAYAVPVVIQLIRNLSPGQRPVLRIGGNSTDETWWPQRGEIAPRHARYALSASWLASTQALASALDANLIMGLNLAARSPRAARVEALVLLGSIGYPYIQAFEIGNEPDLYGLFPWPEDRGVYRRPHSYSLSDFIREFSRWRATIGRRFPVAGPAYATFDWSLGRFIGAEPGLRLVSFHHYPLDACLTNRSAKGYPTIARLLSDQAASRFTATLARAVADAHAHHLPFRLDELNSASCGGRWGVSNSFASALWMLDTLFNLARVGVDGVNLHTFSEGAYASFSAKRSHGRWRAFVSPEYYGMLMFTKAFPVGARLLSVTVSRPGPLKVWATGGPGPSARVVLIDKSQRRGYRVELRAPDLSGPMRLVRLEAPSPSSTHDVTLGGRKFGDDTTTGRLSGRADVATIEPQNGVYTIAVPPASAVLVAP